MGNCQVVNRRKCQKFTFRQKKLNFGNFANLQTDGLSSRRLELNIFGFSGTHSIEKHLLGMSRANMSEVTSHQTWTYYLTLDSNTSNLYTIFVIRDRWMDSTLCPAKNRRLKLGNHGSYMPNLRRPCVLRRSVARRLYALSGPCTEL